jgi:PBP1b-binding outer membrane lipoprotein LpoB
VSRLMTLSASIATIALLTMPLQGCTSALAKAAGKMFEPAPAVLVPAKCPELEPIPDAAIDALETAAREHPEVGVWAVELDQHYDQLDRC